MNLSDFLKEAGLSQMAFAEQVGVTQGAVSKLCKADPKISIELALTIERETNGKVRVTDWPKFAALAPRDQDGGGPRPSQEHRLAEG